MELSYLAVLLCIIGALLFITGLMFGNLKKPDRRDVEDIIRILVPQLLAETIKTMNDSIDSFTGVLVEIKVAVKEIKNIAEREKCHEIKIDSVQHN